MEVRVDGYVEERSTRVRKTINRAYFTEVHVDEQGTPVAVPFGLDIETEDEKADYEGAVKRRELRKHRRREGF